MIDNTLLVLRAPTWLLSLESDRIVNFIITPSQSILAPHIKLFGLQNPAWNHNLESL